MELDTGSYEFWHYFGCRRHVVACVAIVPGKAFYLGNIHINKPPEWYGDCGGAPSIRVSQGRAAQDMALFHARYPHMKPADIVMAGDTSGWP